MVQKLKSGDDSINISRLAGYHINDRSFLLLYLLHKEL